MQKTNAIVKENSKNAQTILFAKYQQFDERRNWESIKDSESDHDGK